MQVPILVSEAIRLLLFKQRNIFCGIVVDSRWFCYSFFFQPFDVCVSPPLVVCPGTLKIGVQYRFPLKVSGEL